MDLGRFDTREAAHEGVDVPLVIEGETQFGDDGEPVTFRIRGLDAPEVRQLLLKQHRAGQTLTPQELDAADMKIARAAVIGWSDNWGIGEDADGKPVRVEFSKANLEKVFSIPIIRSAVLAEVFNRHNFTKRP